MKSGFIAILGRPNVGKSSLMNALVGEKVSIVSPKSQTTRDRIMGILTTEDYQMIFVDTPGVHTARTLLGERMNKAASGADADSDAVVIVLDASKKLTEQDVAFVEKHLKPGKRVYVVINKTDVAGYERIYPTLAKLAHLTTPAPGRGAIAEIIPTSCKTGFNIDVLKKFLEGDLVEGDCYFPEDEITDKSERYMICEIVREKALLFLQDEIPHGIGVYIQSMTDEGDLCRIEVDMICERASHKKIIIGENGEKLKQIGASARKEIEDLLGKRAFIKLFVKVRDGWRDKGNILNDLEH